VESSPKDPVMMGLYTFPAAKEGSGCVNEDIERRDGIPQSYETWYK
jgi:hypothetical protein